MTQRRWKTEDGWHVLTGWDRPLQYFFVTIDRTCTKCNGEGGFGDEPNDADMCPVCNGSGIEYLFNNLDAPAGLTDHMGGMSIEQVKQVLDLKLTVHPKDLMWDLLTDKKNDAGNLIETYETRGTVKEQ